MSLCRMQHFNALADGVWTWRSAGPKDEACAATITQASFRNEAAQQPSRLACSRSVPRGSRHIHATVIKLQQLPAAKQIDALEAKKNIGEIYGYELRIPHLNRDRNLTRVDKREIFAKKIATTH
ncbi:hypothetical protein MMC10_008311 [Thelotrema lepadinum]|nr:hypothetical protein [Thelotrema lepadinum]